ncbi:hypothetical protein ACOSP7_028746 [Xanthoceras sorbifolium]
MTVPSIPESFTAASSILESSTATTSIPESSTATTSPQVILMGTNNNNQHQSLIAINSTQVPIKLTKGGNYAAWRSQFKNLFFGYGLMGYLDVTRSTTSAQAWNKLEATYANRSNTRKLRLLDSLTNVTLAGNLSLITFDDGATVIHTLNGLGLAYLPLASAIRARDTPITFEELYDKLLDHEAFLQRDEAKKGNPVVTTQFNQRTFNRKGRNQQGNSSTYGTTNFHSHQPSLGSSPTGSRSYSSNQGSQYSPTQQQQYTPQNQWRPTFYNNSSRPIC